MRHATEITLESYYSYIEFLTECGKKEYSPNLVLHNHHIIPKHLWINPIKSVNNKNNIIKLSVEDHINAHIKLANVYGEGTYEHLSNLRSARLLNRFSVIDIKMMNIISEAYKGEGNPFFGKTHTPESLQKMSEATLRQKYDTYEDRYGTAADEEREKRKNGVAKSWKLLTEMERIARNGNISKSLKGKVSGSKNGNAHPILVNGIRYGSIAEAKLKLKVNRYYLFKNYIITKIKKQ